MFPIRDHNPSGRVPYVVYALILVNVAVYALTWAELSLDVRAIDRFYTDWGLQPVELSSGQDLHTVFTSMFVHGGLLHLAGNMLFLWVFGDNLEDTLGPVRFLGYYLACGVAAALLQVAVSPWSPVPMVGASGAIAGVMGGYLLLFPKARVDVLIYIVIFFRIFPVRAWIVLMVWIVIQLVQGFSMDPDQGGVAYFAHIGGFIAGMVLMVPSWLWRGGPRFWSRTEGRPPHPAAEYVLTGSRIPRVRRGP